MRVDDFDFDLPRELIASRPARPRDSARLLDVLADGVVDRRVSDLPGLLQPGDVLLFNDTRVIPARLAGRRGEAGVEATLFHLLAPDTWEALVKGAKKLKVGQTVVFDAASGFSAEVLEKRESGEVVLRFDRGGADLFAALETFGHIPLPPYMGREDDAQDRDDYQTIYAREAGAVAAPTAGLHFTPALMDALDARGVQRLTVTLHVGAGTFLPVKVEDTRDHQMHAEAGILDAATADALNTAKREGRRIVCVGTTSLRLLESAAAEDGTIHPFAAETAIFITPGYRFRAVDLLMTNFHLPRSTLFMLVSALAGFPRMKAAYAHAIAKGYRFYSYGDSSLLRREDLTR